MSKYTRTITQTIHGNDRGLQIFVDVYDVLRAFEVSDPAIQHAVKKLLCTGIRGHKDRKQDLQEAVQAIERALDVIKAEEVCEEPLPVELGLQSKAAEQDDDEYAGEPLGTEADNTPQRNDCPFNVGDVIHSEKHPEQHWKVVRVYPNMDTVYVERTSDGAGGFLSRPRWHEYCRTVRDKQPETQDGHSCPFAVGDVIRSTTNPDALAWRVVRVLSDKVEAMSDDGYRTEAHILRKDWGEFSIISKSACSFKAGDVIQSIRWPSYTFRVIAIRAEDMIVDEGRTGGRHRIPRVNWGAYAIKSITAVDKPNETR